MDKEGHGTAEDVHSHKRGRDLAIAPPTPAAPDATEGVMTSQQGTVARSDVEHQEVEREEQGVADEREKLQDQTNLLPKKQVLVVFAGLSCALFCSLLDQTIVSTALPTLGRVFGDAEISSWVGTSYLLTSTACQPMYGRLSDIFGRKIVLLWSLAIFLVSSILCAVSQSMVMLIVFRAVAGIGGGGILTSVMIVVSDVVSLKERGTYQGILGMVVALANSFGPLIGGAFSEKVSWRWCFYINIPLTAIATIVVVLVLPSKRVVGDMKTKLKKVDYLGCLIMFAGTVLVLLALSWGGTEYDWSSAAVIAPLVLGGVLMIVFIAFEMRAAPPPAHSKPALGYCILTFAEVHIFRIPTVAGAMGGTFFSGFMFYCNLYYLPQFYQVVRVESPIMSGVMLLPLVLVQTITSFTSGFLVSKTGNYQINLWFGFAIWAVACGLLSTVSPTISDAKLIGYQILSGVGAGQTVQTSLVAIQASVKRNEMAVATGTRNFVRLLGGTVALAACTAILNNSVRSELTSVLTSKLVTTITSDPTKITSSSLGLSASERSAALLAYTHGIRNIYYFMIPCCCISFFLTLVFVKQHSLNREDDDKLQEEGRKWAEKHGGLHGLRRHRARPDRAEDTSEETGRVHVTNAPPSKEKLAARGRSIEGVEESSAR